MPVDDYGFRADIIIAPEAVVNRMNASQLYEQELNRTSEFIRREIAAMKDSDPQGAYHRLMEYIALINPEQVTAMEAAIGRKKDGKRKMVDAAAEVIYLFTPPSLSTIGPDLVRTIRDKYQFPTSPVSFNLRDQDGNLIRRGVRTRKPVCIGSKYLMLLCKIPHGRSSGIGHINQFGTPVRNKRAKNQYPVGLTPIRLGEDEDRNLTMCTTAETVLRIMSLYANSREGVNLMGQSLLTAPYPTRLERVDISTQRLVDTNMMIKVGKHIMRTVGVEMDNIELPEDCTCRPPLPV